MKKLSSFAAQHFFSVLLYMIFMLASSCIIDAGICTDELANVQEQVQEPAGRVPAVASGLAELLPAHMLMQVQ